MAVLARNKITLVLPNLVCGIFQHFHVYDVIAAVNAVSLVSADQHSNFFGYAFRDMLRIPVRRRSWKWSPTYFALFEEAQLLQRRPSKTMSPQSRHSK